MKKLIVLASLLASAAFASSCDTLYSDIALKDTMLVPWFTWDTPENLEDYIDTATTNRSAQEPIVSMSDAGNVLISWEEEDASDSHKHVLVKERRNGVWLANQDLSESVNPGRGASPHCSVMNAAGDAIVAWVQYNGIDIYIFGKHLHNGTWSTIVDAAGLVDEDDSFSSSHPHAAMDDSGNAIIVWSKGTSGGNNQICIREYRNGVWQPVKRVDNLGSQAFLPRVAMDNRGYAVVVWHSGNGHVYRSQYYGAAPDWHYTTDTNDHIDAAIGGSQYIEDARIVAREGQAVIVFTASDGEITPHRHVYKSELRTWNAGIPVWVDPDSAVSDHIDPGGQDSSNPDIAMDRDGNTIIVWQQHNGTGQIRIYKSEFRNGTWVHPSGLFDPIDKNSPDTSDCSNPSVAMNNRGHAIIIREQKFSDPSSELTKHIVKAVYNNGAWNSNLRPEKDIIDVYRSSGSNQDATLPGAAINDDGNAIVAWQGYIDSSHSHIFKSEASIIQLPLPW